MEEPSFRSSYLAFQQIYTFLPFLRRLKEGKENTKERERERESEKLISIKTKTSVDQNLPFREY